MRLEGKRAIITGGASGFGKEAALLFAEEGADVVILDLDLKGANIIAEDIRSLGRKSLAVAMDVSKEDSVKNGFEKGIDFLKKVDILVNCAGLGRSAKIQDLSLEEWMYVINVNMTGTFLCCREIIQHMIDNKYGKIVNLASICAQTGRLVGVDYAASKSGVVGITRALALQVAPDGINVNAIAPGPVATPLFEKNYTPETVDKLMSTIPYKRRGLPRDIANLILFLSSDDAEWITGEVVAINGGAFIG